MHPDGRIYVVVTAMSRCKNAYGTKSAEAQLFIRE